MPMVLAISWQPGFCETRPKKPECKSQTGERFDARHFTLHGLWPQPGNRLYCNVSDAEREMDRRGAWFELAPLELSATLRTRLEEVMPGSQSALDRHEWVKHGTCYSTQAETYYRDSIALLDAINGSAVQKLFAARVGQILQTNEIRTAFDQSFGAGTGERVRVACKRDGNRLLITELTIGLHGTITIPVDISSLARDSRTIDPGCPGGVVDEVGLQ